MSEGCVHLRTGLPLWLVLVGKSPRSARYLEHERARRPAIRGPMTEVPIRNPEGVYGTLWRLIQVSALSGAVVLLVALVVTPAPTLDVLWNAVIPLLPATFLVSPTLWRNACPLASINKTIGDRWGQRSMSAGVVSAGAVGVVLLYLLVPARRFLLNSDGTALAVVIGVLAIAAAVAGVLFTSKAGFCNSICPVLPVERLYGQRPVMDVANARCAPCILCTRRGCVDLAPTKSVAQVIGPHRRDRRWLFTPFGAFAASFPGFVLGYFTAADVPLASAPSVYAHVFSYAGASFLLVGLATVLGVAKAQRFVLLSAALSAVLYYWFAVPGMVDVLGMPDIGVAILRAAFLALVGFWVMRPTSTTQVRHLPI